eukprot:1226573-Amphidinium_carterae.1
MRRKVSDLKKAHHCTRRPDIPDRSGRMAVSLPPAPRTLPERSQLAKLQMGWQSLPQMEITWMWMASEPTTTLKRLHLKVPGWPVQARTPLQGQTRHFRVPGCPATPEHHRHERSHGLPSLPKADCVRHWSPWSTQKRCDSSQLEKSLTPTGPWLKTPAQAEPGGE